MERVIKTSLTLAMALVMIGLAFTQARADRVSYTAERCFGAGCVTGSVKIGELALAFAESSLGVVDTATSSTALASFAPEMRGVSGLGLSGAMTQTVAADTFVAQRTTKESASVLPAAGMALSFSRLQTPVFTSSFDLGRSFSAASNGSFSVTSANFTATKPFSYNATGNSSFSKEVGGAPGGVPAPSIPEPTTMLLLGTGLAGAAAVVRRRLKVRTKDSK